jgi:hypothetical protein
MTRCADICCNFRPTRAMQGIWAIPEAVLLWILQTKTDDAHRDARVGIFIELSFRHGTYHKNYPYIVHQAVWGDAVPPPVSNTPFGIWHIRRDEWNRSH